MFNNTQQPYSRARAFEQENRFSFANDSVPPSATPYGASSYGLSFGKRILAACAVCLGLASAGGIAALLVPAETHYQARVLAVISDNEAGVKPPMRDVVHFVTSTFTSDAFSTAARAEFGSIAANSIAVEREENAPVVLIASHVQDAALARATADYYARHLTDTKPVDTGVEETRRALQATLQNAQRELADFEQGGASADEIAAPVVDLAELGRAAEEARARAESASKLSLKAVLSGNVDEDLMTPILTELVQQHTEAGIELQSLTEKLGPRHPQFLAAKAAKAAVEQKISRELKRIAKAARAETQAASAEQMLAEKQHKEVAGQQNTLQSQRAQLLEAVNAAAANLQAFENAQPPSPPAHFRLISPAVSISQPMYDRAMVSLAGIAAGILAGLGVFAMMAPRKQRETVVRPMLFERRQAAELAKPVEPGILEQLSLLEEAWPETGRQDEMPTAANDEEAQTIDPAVRLLAMRLASLRQRAGQAAQAGSQPKLEDALVEMRRLRRKVRELAEAKQRRNY